MESETLGESCILEVLFAVLLGLIGVIINKVGKFYILGMFSVKRDRSVLINVLTIAPFGYIRIISIVVSLLVPGSCALICVLIDIPMVQKFTFITLMLSCVAPNIVNAATVEVSVDFIYFSL